MPIVPVGGNNSGSTAVLTVIMHFETRENPRFTCGSFAKRAESPIQWIENRRSGSVAPWQHPHRICTPIGLSA
jgi:hypothetical protein